MRGTLISRKMIAPKSAISTGKSGAAPPNKKRNAARRHAADVARVLRHGESDPEEDR